MAALFLINMKKFFYLLVSLALFVSVVSCKKEPKPEPQPAYTTLAKLLTLAGTTSSNEFSEPVKDIVVTAVYENYVQLEDATLGAYYSKKDHGLKVGDVLSGQLKGKARNNSSSLTLSSLDLSEVTITTTELLPCHEITLREALSEGEKYYNRRVLLSNVTFVNPVAAGDNVASQLSQRGVQLPVTVRHASQPIESGSQGDVICFLSSTTCFIYTDADFEPHEIESPITGKLVCGVYNVNDDKVQDVFVYRPYVDQYGYLSLSSEKAFRIQNYAERWYVGINITSNVGFKPGLVVPYSIDVLGTDKVSSVSGTASVEKMKYGTIWLVDYDNNLGLVIKGE